MHRDLGNLIGYRFTVLTLGLAALSSCSTDRTDVTAPGGASHSYTMHMYVECPFGYIWQTAYDCQQYYDDIIVNWDESDWDDWFEEEWPENGGGGGSHGITFDGDVFMPSDEEGELQEFTPREVPDCEWSEIYAYELAAAWCFEGVAPNDAQYAMMDAIVADVVGPCSFLSSYWTTARPNVRLIDNTSYTWQGGAGEDWMILQVRTFLGSALEPLLVHELLHVYGLNHVNPEAASGFEYQERQCNSNGQSWVDFAGPYVDTN